MPYTREQKQAYDAAPVNKARKNAQARARYSSRVDAERAKARTKHATWRATAGAEAIEKERARSRMNARRRAGIIEPHGETRSGACEICGGDHSVLHLDHWHHGPKDGLIRGWLCINCNGGLGNFRDDPARLQAAIAYLEIKSR
jgi:hypothetical protein